MNGIQEVHTAKEGRRSKTERREGGKERREGNGRTITHRTYLPFLAWEAAGDGVVLRFAILCRECGCVCRGGAEVRSMNYASNHTTLLALFLFFKIDLTGKRGLNSSLSFFPLSISSLFF